MRSLLLRDELHHLRQIILRQLWISAQVMAHCSLKLLRDFLALYPLESIHLILIEQSPEMLAAAQNYCQKSLPISVTFTPICCRIQEISTQQLETIQQQQPIWFINASLSLHHMPKEVKVPTMEMLTKFSTYCLISDTHYNHDPPDRDTPELVYSVSENYGFVIQDVLDSGASEIDKKLCINNFLLTEAINILKNDRADRGDYHTLIGEWQEIADRGQWTVIKTTPTVSLSERPFTFTMELKPKLLI